MKIIDITKRSARWHQWRAQGVTASEAAVILGRSPYQTPWRLWAERTNFAPAADLSANPHVQRGVALEDAARQAFEARQATLLLPVCGESDTHPVLRASFDGIADDGAPVELKVPCAKRYTEVTAQGTQSETFRLYWPQVQPRSLRVSSPRTCPWAVPSRPRTWCPWAPNGSVTRRRCGYFSA